MMLLDAATKAIDTDFDWIGYLVREFPVLAILGYLLYQEKKANKVKDELIEKYFNKMTETTGIIKGFEQFIENIEVQSKERDASLVNALNKLSDLITSRLLKDK